jgi:hypothetical protein
LPSSRYLASFLAHSLFVMHVLYLRQCSHLVNVNRDLPFGFCGKKISPTVGMRRGRNPSKECCYSPGPMGLSMSSARLVAPASKCYHVGRTVYAEIRLHHKTPVHCGASDGRCQKKTAGLLFSLSSPPLSESLGLRRATKSSAKTSLMASIANPQKTNPFPHTFTHPQLLLCTTTSRISKTGRGL